MVLGIGEGSIEVQIEKQTYAPGEAMKGQVTLNLNAAKKARELRISFYGEITEHHREHGKSHSHTKRIYEQKLVLGGEQEYPAGSKTYPFELKVPDIPPRTQSGEGVIGMAVGLFNNLTDPLANAKWYLDSSLDISMAFDINKRLQLNITR